LLFNVSVMSQLFDKAKAILEEIKAVEIPSAEDLEQYRIKYLGSKGIIKGLFADIKNIANEQKKEYGLLVNSVKQTAESRLEELRETLQGSTKSEATNLDLSLPVNHKPLGSRHPLSIVKNEIIDIFNRIGFVIAEGPEIEDDWHNFTALNTPEDHPARDMQDTFYINQNPVSLLRTHTSSAQVRTMDVQQPPIRIICPGRVYRNETISARAHCQFHQVEGLYIDKNVSFADLKQTLIYFAKSMFGENTQMRLRPSFFPFTEPSAEVDITCFICNGKGCSICKKTGWVEILGCGMVDPKVLSNCNIDPEVYTGYAWGMGIDRIAMLRYKVDDIRLFFENDVRFIRQFASA